jgi:hypothetical protein
MKCVKTNKISINKFIHTCNGSIAMTVSSDVRALYRVLALAVAAMASACATPGPDAAPTQVAAAGDSCRPGTFAALESAKLPAGSRPGNASIYKDCR